MEGRLWTIVLSLLPSRATKLGRFSFDSRTILMIGLWAIVHDRPFCWACDPRNWSDDSRPDRLPHPSTLSRRWRSAELQVQAEAAHAEALRQLGSSGSRYTALDGKALTVARHSKDPDAGCGRGAGGLAKGYKLHAMVDNRGVFVAFLVTTLPLGEARVARELLSRAPEELTHVVADVNYDSQPLRRCARAMGRQLYTPIRNNRVGRRQQPERLQMLQLAQRRVGQRLLESRGTVERSFGQLGNFGCGFKGLPNWCRRIWRVRSWLSGKILLYHALMLANQPAA
jgi:IS5 family transposase